MAVNYTTALKTDRMQAVADHIDAGAGAGTLEIGTTGMGLVLATFALAEPCGTVSGDTLTFDFPVTDASADATGTAAEAQIKDGSGVACITGLTVGLSATDIVVDSVDINATQEVTLATGSIQHAT